MKTFNSLSSLFDFVNLCANCGSERKIEPNIGPDFSFKLQNFHIKESSLTFNCIYNLSFDEILTNSYDVKFIVNLKDNSYHREIVNDTHLDPDMKNNILEEIDATDCWFGFNCSCVHDCKLHHTATIDIQFDSSDFTIKNIGIESDEIWLTETENKYFVDSWPQENQTYTAKIFEHLGDYRHKTLVKIPYVPVQFSTVKDNIKKIRLLLTFS